MSGENKEFDKDSAKKHLEALAAIRSERKKREAEKVTHVTIPLKSIFAVAAIAVIGGTSAVILNQNQSVTSDSPKSEVTRDASYQAFGFSFTDELNGINWNNGKKVTFSNPRKCAYIDDKRGWVRCYFDTTEIGHLGKRKCAGVRANRRDRYTYEYDAKEMRVHVNGGGAWWDVVSRAECSQWR